MILVLIVTLLRALWKNRGTQTVVSRFVIVKWKSVRWCGRAWVGQSKQSQSKCTTPTCSRLDPIRRNMNACLTRTFHIPCRRHAHWHAGIFTSKHISGYHFCTTDTARICRHLSVGQLISIDAECARYSFSQQPPWAERPTLTVILPVSLLSIVHT
jgi:hypothetical protein